MGKHAKKSTESTRKSQSASKATESPRNVCEAAPQHAMMDMELQLLDCPGVDKEVAQDFANAIVTDDLGSAMSRCKLVSDAGANPFALRWLCKISKPNFPAQVVFASAFNLAHICGLSRMLSWLIAEASEQDPVLANEVLEDLRLCYGDGTSNSTMAEFARKVFNFMFSPRTANQARLQLKDLKNSSKLGPHVELLVRQFCLNFLAEEEKSLLDEEAHRSSARQDGGSNTTWL
jgi:hypothetical protein